MKTKAESEKVCDNARDASHKIQAMFDRLSSAIDRLHVCMAADMILECFDDSADECHEDLTELNRMTVNLLKALTKATEQAEAMPN